MTKRRRMLNFPSIKIEEPKDIFNFYDEIREDSDERIDVRKVKVNRQRAEDILNVLLSNAKDADEKMFIRTLWVIYGPSSSPDIPYDKVGVGGDTVC